MHEVVRRRGVTAACAVAGVMWLLAVAASIRVEAIQQPTVPTPSTAADGNRAVLQQYCFGCHNQKLKTGGLVLDTLDLNQVPADAEVWERVISKLRAGSMPPPGRP